MKRAKRPDIFNREAIIQQFVGQDLARSMAEPLTGDMKLIVPLLIRELGTERINEILQKSITELTLGEQAFWPSLTQHIVRWAEAELEAYKQERLISFSCSPNCKRNVAEQIVPSDAAHVGQNVYWWQCSWCTKIRTGGMSASRLNSAVRHPLYPLWKQAHLAAIWQHRLSRWDFTVHAFVARHSASTISNNVAVQPHHAISTLTIGSGFAMV